MFYHLLFFGEREYTEVIVNEMLTELFVTKEDNVSYRKMYNDQFHNFYSSLILSRS